MISTNQFKNGTHIEVDGKVFRIMDFQHVKPGKGGAFVRAKLRRTEDGAVIDKTFRASLPGTNFGGDDRANFALPESAFPVETGTAP